MTSLDDALNSSAIELHPGFVTATFKELEPGYSSYAGGVESIRQVGQQVGPNGYKVSHSFDDGLPDPVTATGQNDASGSLTMDLVGRPPTVADASKLTWNSGTTSGSGTGTTITTTLPGDPAFWDYVIVALTVSSDTLVTETSMAADSLYPWDLIGDVSDSGTHTYVFGRKHFLTGLVPPAFKLDASAGYAWVIGSIDCGRTPSNDILVPITPGNVQSVAESVSQTTHTQASVSMANRGWNVGVFGSLSTAGTWTSTGNTIVAQTSGGGVSTALVRSPLRTSPGPYAMSASTASATATVAMVHISFEVRDRPAMDAVSYFSTFNPDSPIYGFDRDTAPVQAYTAHLDRDGSGAVILSQIFAGQMAAIGIDGRTAIMNAVSQTRLLLDNSYTLPTVYGWREGCTTDWIVGYLLAKGSQYIGIPPSIYTRWWLPGYGSLHPYADGSACYTECREWNVLRPGGSYRIGATSVDGPYATAMFGQYTNNSVISVTATTDRNWATEIPGVVNPVMADVFSKANSIGQVTLMIRCDPWSVSAPIALTSVDPEDFNLFTFLAWHRYLGADISGIRLDMNADGTFDARVGSAWSHLTGGGVVADGNWHFVGFYWDYKNGTGRVQFDNTFWNITGNSASDVLPNDDATMIASGGYNVISTRSNLPIAEMQFETGINSFARFRPLPTTTTTYRPTRQNLAVIANTAPIQGWPTLQDLAQSTLAHLRCDESDAAVFVPLDYFGETTQMTVTTLNVLNTDFNAGELNLLDDPSQTRNVVTIQYTDTRVGSQPVSILDMNTSLAVPRGVTYVVFPLDQPTAETHGAAQWWNSTPVFQKLTASQIAGTTAIQYPANVMSVNTLADGTGTVFTSTAFTARIYDWDSQTITVQFTNTYSSTLYLANNGSQIPFLRALGYPIQMSDGYVTVRDSGSIGARRERALTTQLNWVTDRNTAQKVASTLVTLLARPRPQITVTVVGDPRRKPGDLCQLVDSTGMKADGTWRVYSVQHSVNGPQYTQDITLARVGPIGYWDSGTWDESVWGV